MTESPLEIRSKAMEGSGDDSIFNGEFSSPIAF